MKAAVLHEFGQPLRIEDVPIPVPGPGEVLLKVHACGVCHSDLHLAHADWDQLRRHTRLPLILGHEIAGTVESVGEGVSHFRPGDRAGAAWLHWTCEDCEYCRAGRESLCPKQIITGVTVDGGYAEFVKAKASHLIPIPGEISLAEAAPLFCAGLTVYHALNQSAIEAGQSVAVIGIGGLGHLAVQLARVRAAEVSAIDIAPDKLALARECGATTLINTAAGEKPPRVHVAMVCAGSVAAYETALNSLRRGGTLVVVGMPAQPIPIHAMRLVSGELKIISSAVGSRQELRELLDLAAHGKVRCRIEKSPLEDAANVLHRMQQGAIQGRVVLEPHHVE